MVGKFHQQYAIFRAAERNWPGLPLRQGAELRHFTRYYKRAENDPFIVPADYLLAL